MVPLKRQIRKALIEKALNYSKAQETDIYLSAQDLGLSRFAGGAIHQNVAHSDITLNIRSVAGKRLGRATTNDLSDSGVQKAVESAHLRVQLEARAIGVATVPNNGWGNIAEHSETM